MSDEILLLAVTAGAVGFIHTLMGPDHYVPFLVLARARSWSLGRTLAITALCGVGHVLSSVILGAVGIAGGVAVSRMEAVETARADLAGWLLVTVGLVYMTWGLRRALRDSGHRHFHFPSRRQLAVHDPFHDHAQEEHEQEEHAEEEKTEGKGSYLLTPWVLFIVFVLGPCEPLIPLFMVPAARASVFGVVVVSAVFAAATLSAMLLAVAAGHLGLGRLPLHGLERYAHALAGAAILLSGLGVQLV